MSILHLRLIALSSSFCVLAACHSNRSPSPDSELQITGGTRVTARDPIASRTVALVDPAPDIGQYCSGSVLGPHHILTAAHCFNDSARRPFVLSDRRFDPSGPKARLIPVRRVALHARYAEKLSDAYDKSILKATDPAKVKGPKQPLYDIAVAWTDEALPPGLEAVTRIAADPDALQKSSLFAAGFGCQSTKCPELTSELRKVPLTFVSNFDAGYMSLLKAGAKKGSCMGDSGGPDFALRDGDLAQFAIVTTGPESCEAGISVDTQLAPFKEWIERAQEKLGDARWDDPEARILSFE